MLSDLFYEIFICHDNSALMMFTFYFHYFSLTEVFPDAPGETPLTPQDEDYLVIDFSPSADTMSSGQGQGRRVVSEAEWNMLHEEIRRARSHMGRSCQLCTSYQSQLQKVRIQRWNQFTWTPLHLVAKVLTIGNYWIYFEIMIIQ